MTYIHKKLVSTTDFGFVHGENTANPHIIHGWEIQTESNVKFSASESSISDADYISLGKYYVRPTNIFNIDTGEVETRSFHLASMTVWKYKRWQLLTSEKYPLYDINNNYIGYVDGDETYYTDDYLYSQHKWREIFNKADKLRLVQFILMIMLGIYMIFQLFFK